MIPPVPLYRHYLTPEQFTRRFGPTEADYQAVADFARTNGLTVVGRHSNRLLLDVSGSVADIEKAFHLNLRILPAPDGSPDLFRAGCRAFGGCGRSGPGHRGI